MNEPPRDADADEEDLRSRTDLKRARQQSEEGLMQLAQTLVKLADRLLHKLDLSDDLLRVIEEARRIRQPSALNRALRLVRIGLRGADSKAIERTLRNLQDPSRASRLPAGVEMWRARLLGGTAADVTAFLEAFPGASRQQLCTLLRNVRRAPESARPESLRVLTKALRRHVG